MQEALEEEQDRIRADKKARRFDPKLNKIKEIQRKVNSMLNDEKGQVLKKKAF